MIINLFLPNPFLCFKDFSEWTQIIKTLFFSKKITVSITLILVCLGHWSSAQQNHYFNDNARWVYQTEKSYEPGQIFMYSCLYENTISGDTIIEGIQYKKLYKRFIHNNTTKPPFPHQGSKTISYQKIGPAFLRYDAAENKVFSRENVNSSEVVIYNFNATVGDTIALSTEYFNGNKVLRIDTISLLGNHYRLYVLDTSYIPVRNGITSGVGGLNGLNYKQPLFGEQQPTIPPALQIGVPKDLVFQGQNRR